MDLSTTVPIASGAELDAWLRDHGQREREVIIAIHKRSSPAYAVGLGELQEVALCHGWVDVRTQRIDDQRYAICFTPRRPNSNWTDGNREVARRLLAEGRILESGRATLPPDL